MKIDPFYHKFEICQRSGDVSSACRFRYVGCLVDYSLGMQWLVLHVWVIQLTFLEQLAISKVRSTDVKGSNSMSQSSHNNNKSN